MSAGSFCRSPSEVTTTSPRAWSNPAEKAAVWPKLRRRRRTRTRGSRGLDLHAGARACRRGSRRPRTGSRRAGPWASRLAVSSRWRSATFSASLKTGITTEMCGRCVIAEPSIRGGFAVGQRPSSASAAASQEVGPVRRSDGGRPTATHARARARPRGREPPAAARGPASAARGRRAPRARGRDAASVASGFMASAPGRSPATSRASARVAPQVRQGRPVDGLEDADRERAGDRGAARPPPPRRRRRWPGRSRPGAARPAPRAGSARHCIAGQRDQRRRPKRARWAPATQQQHRGRRAAARPPPPCRG